MKPRILLKGIPVAPGFGIGTASFLRPGATPMVLSPRVDLAAPPEEWKKLSRAIHKASRELLRLERKLQKKFSKHESDIFYSHRMILSDRGFLKKLKAVVAKGKGAIETVCVVVGEYIEEFEKIEDPHFRERTADLEDLRQRIIENLAPKSRGKQVNRQGILIAETLVPSDTTRLDPEAIRGILTERGGKTSHTAIIARSLGIPAVMGIHGILSKIQPGDTVIVDGNLGFVYVNPEPEILKEYEKVQEKYADQVIKSQEISQVEATTKDGERIVVEGNVGLYSGLRKIRELGAEGIGLYRTEFPFMVRKKLLDEQEQFGLYRLVVQELKGLPVTFRLLDAGGDKPLEALGLQMTKEDNPFLGYRSIRLSLSRPELLKVQLRALLRASAEGPIRILVPMISGVEELLAVKKIFEEVKEGFSRRKVLYDPKIPFGVLMEVPSAVLLAHLLIRDCDFFSIGTNDLIQYTLAVDRNNEKVAQFFEPLHPAILNAIARVAQVGREAGKRVSICGEIAGDPFLIPLLVGLGVTGLSMIPTSIPLAKTVIRGLQYKNVRAMAENALKVATVEEVKGLLAPFRAEVEKLL